MGTQRQRWQHHRSSSMTGVEIHALPLASPSKHRGVGAKEERPRTTRRAIAATVTRDCRTTPVAKRRWRSSTLLQLHWLHRRRALLLLLTWSSLDRQTDPSERRERASAASASAVRRCDRCRLLAVAISTSGADEPTVADQQQAHPHSRLQWECSLTGRQRCSSRGVFPHKGLCDRIAPLRFLFAELRHRGGCLSRDDGRDAGCGLGGEGRKRDRAASWARVDADTGRESGGHSGSVAVAAPFGLAARCAARDRCRLFHASHTLAHIRTVVHRSYLPLSPRSSGSPPVSRLLAVVSPRHPLWPPPTASAHHRPHSSRCVTLRFGGERGDVRR